MRARFLALSSQAAVCGALLLFAERVQAGVFTWNGGGPDDSWNTAANWSSGYGPIAGIGDELHFAGTTRLTAANNFASGSSFHAVEFDAGAGAFNLTGNSFTLHEAGYNMPRIINQSASTQTFNLGGTLTMENRGQMGAGAVIEADAGNLVFNNAVHAGGRTELMVVGNNGRSITFNGGISSGAEFGLSRLSIISRGTDPQPFTVVITGTNNSYTGGTNIDSGALQLGSIGASPTNGTIAGPIIVGRKDISGNTTPAATLVFAGNGGQTFSNAIEVPIHHYGIGSGAGERAIVGKFSGTNVVTGTLTVNGPVTLATAAGSTLQFNSINKSTSTTGISIGSSTTANAGTISFAGNTDNTGISAVVYSGTLLLAKASSASVHAINHGLGIASGGTVVLGGTGGDQISDSLGVLIQGGTFNTGGLSEKLGALTMLSSSIIDLAHGASVLTFANSSAEAWTGTLSIYNWSGNGAGGGTDRVFFGDSSGGYPYGQAGLTATQLNQITFYSDAGITSLGSAGFAPGMNGEIVPVPEPTTWLAAALATAVFAATHWKRRGSRRTAITA